MYKLTSQGGKGTHFLNADEGKAFIMTVVAAILLSRRLGLWNADLSGAQAPVGKAAGNGQTVGVRKLK